MENYKFSVSMCVYNGDNAQHFDEAVESVIKQTLKPDEIVLVVDGPINDELERIVSKYENQSENFRVIRLEKNSGHGEARRVGLENCRYELTALMDADDVSVCGRFEKQINLFKENPDASIIGGQIEEFIGDKKNIVGKRTVPLNDTEIKQYMKSRCPMNQVTVMFRTKDVKDVGGYIDWYCEEDYYLWLRLALAKKKFMNCSDNLVYVRVGEEMYQRRGGIKYFKSEARLQKYMLDNKIIGVTQYLFNVAQRLVLQVLMPNRIRGWIFKKFARES